LLEKIRLSNWKIFVTRIQNWYQNKTKSREFEGIRFSIPIEGVKANKHPYLDMYNSKCWIFVSRGTIWVANSLRPSSVIALHLMWKSYFQRKWMSMRLRLRTNVSLIIEWFLLNHKGFALQIKVSKTSLIGWTKNLVWFWQFAISRVSLKIRIPEYQKAEVEGKYPKKLSKNHLVSLAMNQEFLSD